ncbi:MAG: GAF domain-containing protein [Bacteroidetes bacterium]|nr:MAG: GAF domain-containing protein [Bacteroidota bacterium]
MAERRHTAPDEPSRRDLLNEVAPQFERFIETRENYIRVLEQTLRNVLVKPAAETDASSSVDELVAMQQLSNSIGTAVEPNAIVSTLVDLTRQVIPVDEAGIFLLDAGARRLMPLTAHGSERLVQEAQQQLESGIVDWLFAEKKTVVIPDLSRLLDAGSSRNFVLVPLILRRQGIGIYIIQTEKRQDQFSHQDIQLLSVLANQAAIGIENWREHAQLVRQGNELKMFQAQMLQAAKLAAVGELAASIVHEIKNPVQILVMQMDIVMSGRAQGNWKEILDAQIKRLSGITKRLMNFSRAVGEEYACEPVDLNKELRFIAEIIAHDYRVNNIDVVFQLAENLPTVPGSINHLQQVFLNMLINARDAMPKGGTMTIATEANGFNAVIRFSDTGTGISRENMDRLFSPFFTTKEAGKGTGLGLSICQKIVSNHKGEIKVESEEGRGTTFIVSLPIRRELQ